MLHPKDERENRMAFGSDGERGGEHRGIGEIWGDSLKEEIYE
jgi:hypothetical protein